MYRFKLITPNVQAASLAVVQLELKCGDVTLGFGTGFLDEVSDRTYLITNWHNVTGRSPETGRVLAMDGITPDRVKVHLFRWVDPLVIFDNPVTLEIPIEYRAEKQWLMHNKGQQIDVVAIEIAKSALDGALRAFLSRILNHHDAVVQVGSAIFVVGFPQALRPTGTLPLWKSGTVATEPSINANNEPCYWIDAITQQGISGSPVFVRVPGRHATAFEYPEMHAETKLVASNHLAFAGIYSGRLSEVGNGFGTQKMSNAQTFKAQLGKVWRPECVGSVITDGIPLDFYEA